MSELIGKSLNSGFFVHSKPRISASGLEIFRTVFGDQLFVETILSTSYSMDIFFETSLQ